MTYNEFIVYCVTSLGLAAVVLLAIIFFQFIMWKIVTTCVGCSAVYLINNVNCDCMSKAPGYTECTVIDLPKNDVIKYEHDASILDWLDNNIFNRECVGLDGKLSEKSNMWVMFAPKGVQGSARAILTAAMEAQKENRCMHTTTARKSNDK